MYSILTLGMLFVFFHQGSSTKEYIVIKTETIKNISVEWNSISNQTTGAILNNSHVIKQLSEEQEFRSSNKTTNSANATLPLNQTSSTNSTNVTDRIITYPVKSSLRFFGKCHKSFKFCQRACRTAYRETCKDFECERNFRDKIKQECDVACDKELEHTPTNK